MKRTSPWSYSLGMLGMTIPSQAFAAYLLYFYVDNLGLAVGLAATARTVFSVWDALDDPFFGYLSDRTRTRIGRRRPWLLAGLIPYLFCFLMTFVVPEAFRHGKALFWYFLAIILLYETVGTVMWENYSALFPEVFRGIDERARGSALKQAFQIVGLVIGIALTPVVYGQLGFAGMAVLYTLLGGALVLLSVLGSHEDPAASAAEPLGLVEAFRATLADRAFWILSLASTLTQFVFGLLTAAMPFYAKYSLGLDGGQTSALFAAVFGVALPMVAFWSWLTRRQGAKTAWVLAIAALALSAVPMFLARGFVSGLLAGAVCGLGFSGVLVLSEVILAELVDRDELRTGRRREGLYYSVNGFITRISGALQGAAFAAIGLLYGYVSGDQPGPRPGDAFRFLMAAIPFVALVIAFFIARRYPAEASAAVAAQEASG